MRSLANAAAVLVLWLSCTSTAPAVSDSKRPVESLGLTHASVVVLPFAGLANPPHSPVAGVHARGLVISLLGDQYGSSVIPLSVADKLEEHRSFARGEYDPETIQKVMKALGAQVAIWGTVDRYIRRRTGSPGQLPAVSLTLYGLRLGKPEVTRVSGTEQGAFGRRPLTSADEFVPTFDEVAEPLVRRLLAALSP